MELVVLIGLLGLLCGFLSGMLGIGGGIIMAPLLLYVPPLFGLDPLSMRVVAGLTIVQGLTAAIFGALAHHKYDRVSPELTLWMGTTIFAAALVGGAGAAFVSNRLLLLVFGGLAAAAAAVILLGSDRQEVRPAAGILEFSRFRAVTAAGAVGLLGGLVGQGGSFLLIPLMTVFIKIPHRIALGSNLAIVLLAGAAAFTGKALTGQIDWLLALPVVVTVIPAAYLGGHLSQKVPVAVLRRCLAVVIGLAAARIWISLLG
ncbi:MAG: sulfite exporter TauE/SafE family protein [Desulfurivibrionaceae bacterium]